jgi:hypothetical protein
MSEYAIIFYMVVAGVLGGISHNTYHDRCGTSAAITTDEVVDMLLWPIVIGVSITVDSNNTEHSKCVGETHE